MHGGILTLVEQGSAAVDTTRVAATASFNNASRGEGSEESREGSESSSKLHGWC
jgi:hypothetical protein